MRDIIALLLICLLNVVVKPVRSVASLKIDNGLVEPPRLECLSDSIIVHVQTRQPFFGRVFVKGQSHLPECSVRGNGPNDETPNHKSLHLPFENCFLRRQRVFNPHGIIVTSIITLSFHPFFLTEADRVYRIQCIYLDAKQSVSVPLSVHQRPMTLARSPPSLPTCKYEILEGGPNGRPVPLASVGTKVYHLWSCQAAEPNKYCALIHSCIAEDGNGVNVQILDDQGCTKDSVLLQNLDYLDDLRAGQTAVVYKFADRESIFFKCEIMVTQKQEGQQCPRPLCTNKSGSNMAHFENAPANSSTSVTFDRRVLALRRALRRRIRDSLSMDVLTELDVLEVGPAEEDLLDNHACKYSFKALIVTIPLIFISLIRFR